MALSEAQYQHLQGRLTGQNFKRPGLEVDLADHLYCLTLHYMNQNLAFEEALRRAEGDLAPNGFLEIDQEVQFFLTYNFQIRMNRVLYSGACLAAFGQTTYVLFRTLHWPFADSLLLMGILALFLMVLPILAWQYFYGQQVSSLLQKVIFWTGFTGLAFFGAGSALKLFYLPPANGLFLLGTGILALFFFPSFFYGLYQKANQKAGEALA